MNAMSCRSRSLVVTTCAVALLSLSSCGRTESLILATGPDTGAETWSYEDTSDPPPDMTTADTIADDVTSEESDDWMTGDWGDEAVDTWGEEDTNEWGEETVDWGETDTLDWGETTDTLDTGPTTDTTTSDTSDTSTETTDTSTSTTSTTETGGDTCADAAQCLIDCGDFSQMCIGDCTSELDQMEAGNLFSLQICAIQACFFAGQCPINNFNDPACIACRLDVNGDPSGFGCDAEGQACGI